jgi:multicomponent Na+:H+ antiporter subunit E
MRPLLINTFLACVWLMLGDDPSISRFFGGYILGFTILALFQKAIEVKVYIRRTFSFFNFIRKFLWGFLKANIVVAQIVLFTPKSKLKPFFFEYDLEGLKQSEIVFLCQCITLTPGTISVLISDDKKTLLIHVLAATPTNVIRKSIMSQLQKPILSFTRR